MARKQTFHCTVGDDGPDAPNFGFGFEQSNLGAGSIGRVPNLSGHMSTFGEDEVDEELEGIADTDEGWSANYDPSLNEDGLDHFLPPPREEVLRNLRFEFGFPAFVNFSGEAVPMGLIQRAKLAVQNARARWTIQQQMKRIDRAAYQSGGMRGRMHGEGDAFGWDHFGWDHFGTETTFGLDDDFYSGFGQASIFGCEVGCANESTLKG